MCSGTVFEIIRKEFAGIFQAALAAIAGFGEGTPQQDLPKGQNRRYADFGTVVESCSKKLPLSSTADFAAIRRGRLSWFPSIKRVRRRVLPAFAPLYGRKRKMPNAPLDFFITTTAASPFRANFPVTFYNNRNVWSAKNGRKKNSKSFQTYCLCAAVMGGGYSVVFAYFSSVNWELSLQGLFFSK